jgi:hypothetical protein
MIAPTVSKIKLKGQEYPIVEFFPKAGKRIVLFTGVDDHFKPTTDEGFVIRVYSNGSFMMSDDAASKIVDGVITGVAPKSPRIYDSAYRYIVAGA